MQASTRRSPYPHTLLRNGDFSGLRDAQGRLYTLYDPRHHAECRQ